MTDQPERRRVAGQFITMDAAMLAAQNERLDRLNDSIEKLSEAVTHRPTKFDLKQAQKRIRNQLIATIALFLLLAGLLYGDQRRLDQQCLDRNNNTLAFRALIVSIVERNDDPVTETALTKYLETLVEIDC